MKKSPAKSISMHRFEGIPASPGISIGPVSIFAGDKLLVEEYPIRIKDIDNEVRRFRNTVSEVINDLEQSKKYTENNYGHELAEIFSAQIALLEDEAFLSEVDSGIIEQRKNVEYVVFNLFKERKEYFLSQKNEYFKDRAYDILALKNLILAKLQGHIETYALTTLSIVVAPDLSPKDTINFDRRKILGFAVDHGGRTSHTAILARSLEIPCVVGLHNFSTIAQNGDTAIIDGSTGTVILNPDKKTLSQYEKKQQHFEKVESNLLNEAVLPVYTPCGVAVELMANLELKDEIKAVKHVGAKGIGLLRTEGVFIEANHMPDENKQTEIYSYVASQMAPLPVTIRALDIGGDKVISGLSFPTEANPFLGWRAIRFLLESKTVFKHQLRAILRSSAKDKNIKIMLPLITTIDEVRNSKLMIEECKRELRKEKIKFDNKIELGIMVETPVSALMCEAFADEVDFFSIGTNDLTMYTLAVDRGNEKISKLYNHFHPGVIQLIKKVIDVSAKKGIPVSLCGEMAGDSMATILLLGLGLRKFSAAPIMIPAISKIIRETRISEAKKIANKVLKMKTTEEVEKYLSDYTNNVFGNIIY